MSVQANKVHVHRCQPQAFSYLVISFFYFWVLLTVTDCKVLIFVFYNLIISYGKSIKAIKWKKNPSFSLFVFLLSMNKSLTIYNNLIFTSTSLKLVSRLFSDAAFTRDGFKETVYDKYGLRNKLNAMHLYNETHFHFICLTWHRNARRRIK